MFLKRLAIAGTCAFAAVLALGTAASAAVPPFTYYTQVSAHQASGYFASAAGGFTHVEGWIGSNASSSLENLQAGDGLGYGLCDQGSGQAIQAGVIRESATQIRVSYGIGVFSLAGHSCFNGLVSTPVPLWDAAVGDHDTIDVQVLFDAHRSFRNNGTACRPGQALVEARDVTSDPGTWHKSGCISVSGPLNEAALGRPVFDEADAGVVADTQHMSAPAVNYLATFAHVGLTSAAGHHGSFQADAAWAVYRVVGTTNGLSFGTHLLVPQPFANDHFDMVSGIPSA